jgi:hypothetical protein
MLTPEDTESLLTDLGGFAYDPYAFVMWAFPWGEPGTELAKETGPDEWQTWVLKLVRDDIISLEQAMLIAVTSGHGIGKSALVSWLVLWAYSTFPGTRGVVTANTENQLKTKTWVEIAKWTRLFIARDLFKLTATALFSVDENQSREWRIDIVPWSERNTEAFAGLHNAGKRILIIFDEASAIPDIIWETTEGALTDADTEILWFVFGNPTRDKGRFRECFPGGRFGHRWHNREVDSRTVKRTNKEQLQQWIDDYGLDSDFVRVRVLGKFPRTDINSFITREMAVAAINRPLDAPQNGPVVLGVDVARFGDDFSVIWPRQGRDALSRPVRFYQGLTTTRLTQHVIQAYNEHNAAAVFIDGGGVGGGVVDSCRDLGLNVYEVQFGARADGLSQGEKYMNKRAEIWGLMREWLKVGAIPERIADRELLDDLTGPGYTINVKDNIQLESKDMMKRRGIPSPDMADALACTFAFPYVEHPMPVVTAPASEYNPFQEFS